MIPKYNTQKLLPRKLLSEVTAFFDTPEILLLIGARQVGKTSILYLIIEELKRKGVRDNAMYFFDLEDLPTLDIFNSGAMEFISYLKSLGADTEKRNFIFVDEIQYMANPTNFLKLLADRHKNLKLIVSGSSTLEIRQRFKDSLAGRKVVFEVFPLDFYEFLIFKDEMRLAEVLLESDIRHLNPGADIENIPARFFNADMARYFNEYVVFGGYPRVAMEAEYDRKAVYLNDIYNSYVKKDIKDIVRVDNITAFNNLIKVLSIQVGNLINLSELCTAVKIARETLERYLFLLENTFIIKTVTPFSRNPRKEISKMSKVYFVDTGLRNMVLKNFSSLESRVDTGALIESTVCGNILKNLKLLEEMHFWRTLSRNEVDIVITKGGEVSPIEVKYSPFKSPRVPAGIRSFAGNYPCERSVVLTRDYFGRSDKTIFLPVWLC